MKNETGDQGLKEWHRRQVEVYGKLRGELEAAAERLTALLTAIADRAAPDSHVRVRVKSILSVSEKILRWDNPERHPRPLDKHMGLPDLLGGQIITYTRRDAAAVCGLIERLALEHPSRGDSSRKDGSVEIDESSPGDTSNRLGPSEFGYTAEHFILRVHGARVLGVDISTLSDLGRKMEVQVSTATSYTWSVVTHDRMYKADLTLPKRLQRRVAEAKAMLDAAEHQMEEAIVDLDRYRRRHAGRLHASQGEHTNGLGPFDKAKLVCDSVLELSHDALDAVSEDCLNATQVRADLAMAEADWETAERLLEAACPHRPALRVPLAEARLRRLGGAGESRALLESALADVPYDPQAASALSDLILSSESPSEEDYQAAVSVLDAAFLANPHEPELLLRYATARVLQERFAARLCTIRGAFDTAIGECRKRYELGADVPECVLQHARLALLADDLYGAVNNYCLSAALHTSIERLRQERHVLGLLQQRLRADPGEPRVGRLLVGLENACQLLDLLIELSGTAHDAPSTAKDPCSDLRGGPVVILAGGCAGQERPHLQPFEQSLERAFRRFAGVLISGGTTAGISGLAGRIAEQAANHRITLVGYLPPIASVQACGDEVDGLRYTRLVHVRPENEGDPVYSPLGPIRMWRDLLTEEINPSSVRLVGVNGGDLSGFEYRLALTMGATVGLVETSGRAVNDLLRDSRWNRRPGLARLLNDEETIEMFVNAHANPPEEVAGVLTPTTVEDIARRFHQSHMEANAAKREYVHDSMLSWEDLDDVYRDSNLAKANIMSWILASEGFAIVPKNDPRPAIHLMVTAPGDENITGLTPKPEYDQRIARMARLEHARWNAERLALGWTPGFRRSLRAKTSPWIIPWNDLPREIQQYDLEPFLQLAQELACIEQEGGAGLKVVDLLDSE